MVIAASPVPIGLITAKRGKETQEARSREQGMHVTSGSDIRQAAIGSAVMLPVAHRALRRHLDDSATTSQDTNEEGRLDENDYNKGWMQGSGVDISPAAYHDGIRLEGDDQAQVSDAQPPEKPDHDRAHSHKDRSLSTDSGHPASRASYDSIPPRHMTANSADAPLSTSAQSAETPNSGTQEPSATSETSDQKIHLPIFNDVAASLVRAEMDTIRRKYADAMRLLRGAPLAKVDVLVDPGVDEHWDKGHVSGGDGNVTTPAALSAPPVPGSPGGEASGGPAEMDRVLRLAPDVALEAQNKDRKADTTQAVVRQMHASEKHDGSSSAKQTGPRPQGVMKRGQYDSPAVPLKSWIQGRMDVLYYGTVRLGDPEQLLGVDFDTGSADLWVPVRCSTCANNYDAAKSSRSSYTGDRFQVQYGSGRVSGRLVQDIARLGSWTVPNQYFGAVDERSDDFEGNPNDGVMGMAFSSIASSGKKTFFENLIDQGSVRAPIFAFHLTRRKPEGSQLCVGCYDSSKYYGGFTWVPIISKTYWSVSMTGFTASTNKANALSRTLIGAIDTGTTLIYVPPRVAASFYKQIPGSEAAPQFGQGFYQYPCAADDSLQLALGFNGKGFRWDVSDFNLGRTGRGSSMCVGAILAVADGFPEDLAIIGDVFMKSWYTIFDQSNDARIGLAASVNNA